MQGARSSSIGGKSGTGPGLVLAAALGAAFIAGGLGLFFGGRHAAARQPRAVTTGPADERSSATAEERESALELQRQLRLAVLTRAAEPPAERDEPGHAEVVDPGDNPEPARPIETDADRERLRQEERARLEQHFTQQSDRGAWSRDTSMAINNALVGALKPVGSLLKSVDCRGSLCRVEVATSDETQYEETFQAVLQARWSFGTGPSS